MLIHNKNNNINILKAMNILGVKDNTYSLYSLNSSFLLYPFFFNNILSNNFIYLCFFHMNIPEISIDLEKKIIIEKLLNNNTFDDFWNNYIKNKIKNNIDYFYYIAIYNNKDDMKNILKIIKTIDQSQIYTYFYSSSLLKLSKYDNTLRKVNKYITYKNEVYNSILKFPNKNFIVSKIYNKYCIIYIQKKVKWNLQEKYIEYKNKYREYGLNLILSKNNLTSEYIDDLSEDFINFVESFLNIEI